MKCKPKETALRANGNLVIVTRVNAHGRAEFTVNRKRIETMKKKRRLFYQRRARSQENIADGQDSFLDVVSNLVGILIILVMVAGARVHSVAEKNARAEDSASVSTEEALEREQKQAYVDAVDNLTKTRQKLEKSRLETEELNERFLMVEQQAEGAEAEYRELLARLASVDAIFKEEVQKREDSEQEAFEVKSAIFEKEKKLSDLQKEKDALAAARPKATVLENIPTPISKRVEEGREGFYQLKNGRLAYVPLNEFQERLRLSFKNFRGDLTKKTIDETIGPIDQFKFHYLVNLDSIRSSEGIEYFVEFKYGECIPTNDEIGEPVDVALESRESKFCRSLLKFNRQDTTITIFVYPDSYEYLRDIKKLLFSLQYQMALRPLPNGAPIALSPNGTASASY